MFFSKWLRRQDKNQSASRKSRRRPLALEHLESRLAPATFIVNTVTDNNVAFAITSGKLSLGGVGSGDTGDLRYCISQANMTTGSNTIDFALPANSTITLNQVLMIYNNVTIDGSTATNLTISGGGAVRPFFVIGGTVSIDDVTVANGLAQGGAGGSGITGGGGGAGMGGGLLVNSGTVTLTNVIFTNDQAVGGAGGNGGGAADTAGGGGGAGGAGGSGLGGNQTGGSGGGFLGNGGGISAGTISSGGGGGGGLTGAGGAAATASTNAGSGGAIGGGGGGADGGTGGAGNSGGGIGGNGRSAGNGGTPDLGNGQLGGASGGGGGSSGFPLSSAGTAGAGGSAAGGFGGFGGGGGGGGGEVDSGGGNGGDYGGGGGGGGQGAFAEFGGFGGGGGGAYAVGEVGGNGGFGGGGGGGRTSFATGGGQFGGNGGNNSGGGGGAGLGGAIFVRAGNLTLANDTFTNDTTTGGSAGTGGTGATGGQGKGGALFINSGVTAIAANTTFSGNSASNAGTTTTNPQDNNNVYGTLTVPTVSLNPGTLPAGNVNIAYAQFITASGGTGAIRVVVSNVQNAIPGLYLGAVGNELGIQGTPTAPGAETFTVTATDSIGATVRQSYSIHVLYIPTLTTTPNPSAVTLGNNTPPTLTDTADLENGYFPTGTITFTLSAPNGNIVDTESATVNGNGTYSTPTGYTLPSTGTVTGTYQWNASYSGDVNNNPFSPTPDVIAALAEFNGTNGSNPESNLVEDSSGNFFGTTYDGGTSGYGAVFEVAAGSGAITTLASFNSANGVYPSAGLVEDSHGNLFGTTGGGDGGVNTYGTVFEVAAGSGTITTLASFNGTNGSGPYASLVEDSNGNLFGATTEGGSSGNGTVFEVAAGSGTITDLASFNGANGSYPYCNLVEDRSGNLFGTTAFGGANDDGTVFEVAAGSGVITTLASFNGTNGNVPYAGVIEDGSGNLFGTTYEGGAHGDGTVFAVVAGSGAITALASFNGVNGIQPSADLIEDSSGNLFGTTAASTGANSDGTVFEVAAGSGAITTLAYFNGSNGSAPFAGVIEDSSGKLFGTAEQGGDASDDGTVFQVSPVTSEQVSVSAASPTLATTPTPTSAMPGQTLTDAANLQSGYHPTGTITFTLYDPNGNLVDTETATVSGNGSYTTPTGYTLPGTGSITGEYQWDVSYGGDGNNNAASDLNDSAEQVAVTANTSSTTTIADNSSGSSTYGQSVTFTASVTNSGVMTPTGSVQFFDNGNLLGTGTTLTGTGNSATSTFTIATLGVTSSPHPITAVFTSTSSSIYGSGSSADNFTVNPATLTVSGITANNKVYNSTTAATLNVGSAALHGVYSGDTVTLSTSGAAGTFASKDVANGITVTVAGLTIGGAQAGDYTLTQPTTTANITPATLTVSGITASNKVYNSTTAATLSVGSAALVGVYSGDTVTLSTSGATGTFASKDVANGITVAVAGLTIGGAQAGDYTLTQPTTTANITPATLTVSGITASNKVYNSTTAATLSVGSAALVGVYSGDTVTLSTSDATGTFASKNVANGITVTVAGLTIGGAQAGDYTLTQPTTTANITAATLTVSGITASNKVYNGTTAATLNVSNAALVGVYSGDTVTLGTSNASGTFAAKNVANGITVTVSGLTIGGAQAGDYTLTQPTTTANITPAALSVTANNQTMVYGASRADSNRHADRRDQRRQHHRQLQHHGHVLQ